MSTILKALRRVEDDRNAQAPPPIREQVATRPDGGGSRTHWFAMLAALAGGAVVGIAVLFFWSPSDGVEGGTPSDMAAVPTPIQPREPAEPPKAVARSRRVERPSAGRSPTPPPPSATSESASGLARVPANLPSASAPPVMGETLDPNELSPEALRSDVAVIERPPAEPRILPDAKAEKLSPPVAVAPAPRVREPVATRAPIAAPPPPRPAPVPEPKPEPVRVAAKRPAPPPEGMPFSTPSSEPAPLREAAPPVPSRSKSAPKVTSPFPEIVVTRTVWHPRADRRTAEVELPDVGSVELREGDFVGALKVGTIEPSAVVFQHDGVDVRWRVGEGR